MKIKLITLFLFSLLSTTQATATDVNKFTYDYKSIGSCYKKQLANLKSDVNFANAYLTNNAYTHPSVEITDFFQLLESFWEHITSDEHINDYLLGKNIVIASRLNSCKAIEHYSLVTPVVKMTCKPTFLMSFLGLENEYSNILIRNKSNYNDIKSIISGELHSIHTQVKKHINTLERTNKKSLHIIH